MALRWFVGLGLEEQAWDASTFSQNRRRRFDTSGVLERLFDQTVKRAIMEKLISEHVTRFVSKGSSGSGAYPGYTVNALMENRNRILLGVGVEIFRSSTSEEQGALSLLDRAKHRLRFKPQSLGADKGFFHEQCQGS